MQFVLFWIFAIVMLAFAAGVVLFRSPVNSAMCLVMSFIFLAGLFGTLDAFFIMVIQVLVYAGAVMVLFLFIIMLFNLRSEKPRPFNVAAWAGSGLVLVGFAALMNKLLFSNQIFVSATALELNSKYADVAGVGRTLFHDYNLPFQVIGVLLLVATIGVVLLSKRELK